MKTTPLSPERPRQHPAYPLLMILLVIGLAALADLLDGFLGRDAAACFVGLAGFVLLTFDLPRWAQYGIYLVIAGAFVVLISRVLGRDVATLTVLFGGLLMMLTRIETIVARAGQHVPVLTRLPDRSIEYALELAAVGLIFALGIQIAGQTAGPILAAITGLLFVTARKLPTRYAAAVALVCVGVIVAVLISLTGLGLAVLALGVLGFLLLYQPHLGTRKGLFSHLLVALLILVVLLITQNSATFGLSIRETDQAASQLSLDTAGHLLVKAQVGTYALRGELGVEWGWRGTLAALILGLVANFILLSTPRGGWGKRTWERGIFSRLELQTWYGRAIYRAIILGLLLLAVTVAFPFAFAFTAGLKDSNEIFTSGLQLWPDDPLWETYRAAWERFDVLRLFRNTLVIVVNGMLFQIGVSTLAAYSLSRLKPKGGRYWMLGFLLTLMIPNIAYLVPLYVTIAKLPLIHVSLLGSYWGIWLPYGVNAFSIFVLKNFFDALPSELFDAAKVDGAGPLQILWFIALPLSRSILIVLAILAFVGYWKDFLWPYLVLLTDRKMQPISVHLYEVTTSSIIPMNEQMAAYFLAMVPPLLVAVLLQRYMRQGLSIGAVKG